MQILASKEPEPGNFARITINSDLQKGYGKLSEE